MGRMLNYGDLTILTAAEDAVDRYHLLRDPKTFKKTMLTQKHTLETEFMYAGGRPPSPPLRAAETDSQPMVATAAPAAAPAPATATVAPAPATSAVPAPAPAPEPVADDGDQSREITETLARLADLRDSGAITPEDYEQKKDELLGRL